MTTVRPPPTRVDLADAGPGVKPRARMCKRSKRSRRRPNLASIRKASPLSPLLSKSQLDELDRETERRGHRFVRYADSNNTYAQSEKAGRRVMAALTRFIERRLKLQINMEKSAVADRGTGRSSASRSRMTRRSGGALPTRP